MEIYIFYGAELVFKVFQLAFWYILIPYILYYRIISMYIGYYHYIRQKNMISTKRYPPFPFLGDIPYFFKYLNND